MASVSNGSCPCWLEPLSYSWRHDGLLTLLRQFFSKSKSHYDRQSVGQSFLVSDTHLEPATTFSPSLFNFLSRQFRIDVDVGALSDEKSGLYFSVKAFILLLHHIYLTDSIENNPSELFNCRMLDICSMITIMFSEPLLRKNVYSCLFRVRCLAVDLHATVSSELNHHICGASKDRRIYWTWGNQEICLRNDGQSAEYQGLKPGQSRTRA
jgi:hypothetical protein